jgi:hypothetical protein
MRTWTPKKLQGNVNEVIDNPIPVFADPEPVSGAFQTPGSGKNDPDLIFENLLSVFWDY